MIGLIEPWFTISSDEKEKLMQEYRKEIHKNHVLYNIEIDLIGRRSDRDDILFYLPEKNHLAIVHLTWSGKSESGNWPFTHIQSIEDFTKGMKQENEMW